MTTAPDPRTIDFAAVFAGISYPKDSVTVILDEELGYRVHRLQADIRESAMSGDSDKRKELEAESDRLAEDAKAKTYVFHLTGVARELREGVAAGVEKEFELKRSMFGNIDYTPEAEAAHNARIYALHIERISGPGGAELVAPTAENLAEFLKHAPDKAIIDINAKIKELSGEGASDGFDYLIRNADFLSTR